MDYLQENMDWVFSGVGVFLFGVLPLTIWLSRRPRTPAVKSDDGTLPASIDTNFALFRVLVIDDNEFAYLDLLLRDGFNASRVADIDSLSEIDSYQYDLILLDLHGVGARVSKQGAIGILRHLSETCPSLPVIAYSAAKWRMKDSAFFELATETFDKSDDYLDFRRAIERQLRNLGDPDHYVKKAGIEPNSAPTLTAAVKSALASGRNPLSGREIRLHFAGQDVDRVRSVLRHAAIVGSRLLVTS